LYLLPTKDSAMTQSNRRFLLAKRPVGAVRRDDFTFETVPAQAPAEGQIQVRNLYLSLDPAMRGWMNEGKSYIPPVALGQVMRALGVGEVVASKHPDYKPGDHVSGALGVQDYFTGEPQGLHKIDPRLAPLPWA
jgi:NADPH-dependent curcumin reductase CurA